MNRQDDLRRAFATYLWDDAYIPGVIALRTSLTMSRNSHPLICVIGPEVTAQATSELRKMKIIVRQLGAADVIEVASKDFVDRYSSRPEVMFTKLNIFNLTEFDTVLYLDADTIVLRNLDSVFTRGTIFGAVGLSEGRSTDTFSAGVLLIEPSADTFAKLKNEAVSPRTTGGGRGGNTDQTLLNEFFSQVWLPLPSRLNVSHKELRRSVPVRLFGLLASKAKLPLVSQSCFLIANLLVGFVLKVRTALGRVSILHFDGKKPWSVGATVSDGKSGEARPLDPAEKLWWSFFRRGETVTLSSNE